MLLFFYLDIFDNYLITFIKKRAFPFPSLCLYDTAAKLPSDFLKIQW